MPEQMQRERGGRLETFKPVPGPVRTEDKTARVETVKEHILMVGLAMIVAGGSNMHTSVAATNDFSFSLATLGPAAEAKGGTAPHPSARERKIPLSDATSAWGVYGVPPESPDGKRLCYVVYPEPIDLARKERYPIYPAELWVCNLDGTGHRMLLRGRGSVHNGLGQSWVDDKRIVFASQGATRIVNADTGKMDFGPFKGFSPAHFAVGGKVLMYLSGGDSTKQQGLYEFDTATGKMRLVLPYTKSINHAQYSPDGRKALFTTNGNFNLAVVNLDGTGLKVFPDQKPMHFQWFDKQSFFGYVREGVLGVDLDKHDLNKQRDKELYRWDLEGRIIEHLAGYGCHGAARADRKTHRE